MFHQSLGAYIAVADPGFSRGGGREPSRGGVNTPNFPENCMKSKEFGRPGGGVRPSRPPLDPPMHCTLGVLHFKQANLFSNKAGRGNGRT